MPAPTLPQVATLDQSVVVSWANGDLFNGFLLLGLVLPVTTTTWAEVDLGGQFPGERLPIFTKVPIVSGQFSNSVGVIYTSSLNPPNTRYAGWYYDNSSYPPRQIAGPTATFAVTSATLTPTVPTLTTPTVGVVLPVPD